MLQILTSLLKLLEKIFLIPEGERILREKKRISEETTTEKKNRRPSGDFWGRHGL